ncbi:MAG TPA: DUF2254 family protein, partial [Thermoanaerobaculia bacterium]|nr:DUF2254 family protein [Thermoanaerobaculia bacterium]
MTSVRVRNAWDLLSSSLWFVPTAMTVVAIAAAVGAIAADRSLTHLLEDWFFLYSGGAEGARSVLSTIAGSMITVAGVAFSITIVALT